jgi:hypothetical protein
VNDTARIRSTCLLAAGALACAVLLSPAHAGESNTDGKASQAEQKEKGRETTSQDDSAAKAPSDLESCKRDADGMKGPERSRFMTACIKERK